MQFELKADKFQITFDLNNICYVIEGADFSTDEKNILIDILSNVNSHYLNEIVKDPWCARLFYVPMENHVILMKSYKAGNDFCIAEGLSFENKDLMITWYYLNELILFIYSMPFECKELGSLLLANYILEKLPDEESISILASNYDSIMQTYNKNSFPVPLGTNITGVETYVSVDEMLSIISDGEKINSSSVVIKFMYQPLLDNKHIIHNLFKGELLETTVKIIGEEDGFERDISFVDHSDVSLNDLLTYE